MASVSEQQQGKKKSRKLFNGEEEEQRMQRRLDAAAEADGLNDSQISWRKKRKKLQKKEEQKCKEEKEEEEEEREPEQHSLRAEEKEGKQLPQKKRSDREQSNHIHTHETKKEKKKENDNFLAFDVRPSDGKKKKMTQQHSEGKCHSSSSNSSSGNNRSNSSNSDSSSSSNSSSSNSSSSTSSSNGKNSSSKNSSSGCRDIDRLAINKAFAEVYEQRKRRELLQKEKDLLEEASSEESSSSSEEDEDAALVSAKVGEKVLDLITTIRRRDPCIYDAKQTFFVDEDFSETNAAEEEKDEEEEKEENEEERQKKKKGKTYAEVLRETLMKHGAAAYVEEEEKEEEREGVPSHGEEMEELKSAFLHAAEEWENRHRRKKVISFQTEEEEEEGKERETEKEEDDFLKMKQQQHGEKKGEEEMPGNKEKKCRFPAALGQEARGSHSDAVLQKYWAADEELNADERFLRDYILNEAWREDRDPFFSSSNAARFPLGSAAAGDEEKEEEDRIFEEQTDLFEATYNFRYEEEGRHEIKGHARRLEGTLRLRNEKRKRQRELKKLRKEEEKRRRDEEIKRLKNLKKEELCERLKQIQNIAGLHTIDPAAIDLEADFDPAAHDAEMGKIFGNDYEQQQETSRSADLLRTPEGFEETLDTAAEASSSLEELTNKQKKLLLLQQKKKAKREKRKRQQQQQEIDDGDAYAPLGEAETAAAADTPPKKQREGEDETATSGEKKKKKKQEEKAAADKNESNESPAEETEWWMCDGCGLGIPGGKKRFDCTTCENFTLCKMCFHRVRHPHHLIKKTVPPHCKPPAVTEEDDVAASKSYSKLLDEYFQVDYEDVIGGDLPTRFKYTSVPANTYGMSVDEILSKTDKELNAKLSLKKLAPYRDTRAESKRKLMRSQYMRRTQEEHKQGGHSGRRLPRDDEQPRMTRFGVTQTRLDAYMSKK